MSIDRWLNPTGAEIAGERAWSRICDAPEMREAHAALKALDIVLDRRVVQARALMMKLSRARDMDLGAVQLRDLADEIEDVLRVEDEDFAEARAAALAGVCWMRDAIWAYERGDGDERRHVPGGDERGDR